MNRDNFVIMLNDLKAKYSPRNTFDTDDYYDQVKFLFDSDLPRLRALIIEKCDFFPKPAELRKLGYELKPIINKPGLRKCKCGVRLVYDTDKECIKCSDERYDRENPGHDVVGDFRKAIKMLEGGI